VRLASRIFWNLFPEIQGIGTRHQLHLSNGVRKQGKGSPRPREQNRFSGKKFQKVGCSLSDFRVQTAPRGGMKRPHVGILNGETGLTGTPAVQVRTAVECARMTFSFNLGRVKRR
jgi:hypothetical protein